MLFTGTFKNYENNKTYKVTIGGDGSWMPITDPSMQEFEQYDSVCFDTDPVHITCTRDDLQQRILIRQCTIELKTKLDMSSMLIADTNRTIPVKVEIVNDEGGAPQSICTIFDGFMDPLTFNQGMAHNYESFTIHATDPMGALENLKVNVLEDSSGNYAQDKIEYIGQVLTRLFSVADMTMYTNEDFGSGPYPNYPGNNERVNMQVFFGEDQDDWMTLYEILDTICKFNGYLAYYNPIDGYAHVTSMYDPLLIPTGIDLEHNVLDEDTEISTDDVYSQVTLQCDIEPNDDDVSLLDDDFLYSDYKNYQKYMTELACQGDGFNELMALKELCNAPDGTEKSSNGGARRTEHFCQVLRNDAWSFGSNSYITAMNGAEETDENDAVKMTGDQSNVLTWLKNNPGKGAFIQFGKGNDIKNNNTAPTGAPKMTDYLVISIQGHNDHRVSGGHYDNYSNIFNVNNFVCEYTGLASKNLTPPDDTITNYLLISGKMILNPLQKKTGINWADDTGFPTNWHNDPSYMNLYNASTNTFQQTKSTLNGIQNFWNSFSLLGRCVPSNNDGGEYYTQKWWSCSDPANPSYSVKGNEGLIGFLGNKNNEICQYAWSEHGEANDEIDKMPVLVCSLKIGNKWAVEIFNSSYDPQPNSNYDYKKGKIVWLTEQQWGAYGIEPVFSIGFDPQTDDKFVGHEYKFANNVVESMKIEGDGMAIPITYGDKLNGKVEFKILRPYNSDTQFNRIERVHPSFWRHTSWNDHCFWILEFLDSIMISDLKLEIKTDAAKINQKLTTSDNDLVYYSATHPDYIEKLEDETKICSALTMDECQDQGIKYQTSNSYVLDGEDMFLGWTVGNDKVRPEEMFVDYYFQHCCDMGARVGQDLRFLMRILETTVKDTALKTKDTSGYSNVDDLGYKMATGILSGDLSYGMDNPIQNGVLMSYDWSLAKREIEIKIREMNPNYHSVWS